MRNRYAVSAVVCKPRKSSPRLVESQWGSIYFEVSHICSLVPPIFPKMYLIHLREDKSKAKLGLHLESLKALATTTARAVKTSSLTQFRVYPNFLKINPATMEFQIKRNFFWSVILGHPTQLYKTGHKQKFHVVVVQSWRQRNNQKKWCMCRVGIFFIKRLLHMTFWTTWWNTSEVKISPGQPATGGRTFIDQRILF